MESKHAQGALVLPLQLCAFVQFYCARAYGTQYHMQHKSVFHHGNPEMKEFRPFSLFNAKMVKRGLFQIVTSGGDMATQAGSKRTRMGTTSSVSVVKASRRKAKGDSKFYQKTDTRPEQKYTDNLNIGTAIDSVGAINQITNAILQGTAAQDNRIGLNIVVKSINISGFCYNSIANLTANQGEKIRWYVFVDKQANGSATGGTNVYTQLGTVLASSSARDMAYLDRFDVLAMDEFYLSAAGPNIQDFSRYIKVNIPVRYAGSTASTPLTNAIYVMAVSSNNSGANKGVVCWDARMQYTDE